MYFIIQFNLRNWGYQICMYTRICAHCGYQICILGFVLDVFIFIGLIRGILPPRSPCPSALFVLMFFLWAYGLDFCFWWPDLHSDLFLFHSGCGVVLILCLNYIIPSYVLKVTGCYICFSKNIIIILLSKVKLLWVWQVHMKLWIFMI